MAGERLAIRFLPIPICCFTSRSEQRWLAAAALLGIDLNLLSADAGHA
jgi:putative AlgH/UPF0301 family transcriptional regulator